VNDDVSRIHASILTDNGSFIITDKSTNGTLVNDKKIDSHSLQPGDTITISDWKIKFEASQAATERETVIRDITPTKILKFETKKSKLVTEQLELSVTTPDGNKQKTSVTTAVIGASPDSSIIIQNDPYVSNKHCAIKCEGEGFVVEDLGSKNGTFLNGERVTRKTLPSKGELAIGRTVINFAQKQTSEKLRPVATTSLGPILGRSETMRQVFSLIGRIAPSDATACIIGESGTGKELVARYLHEAGPRRARPFVALNCGAIPATLIESELFGHEKGSFTSATNQHRGVFEQAGTGTLFLDEIGEMPPDLQTRLLRVLETKHLRRVGGSADIPVDVRVIAATNRDLKHLVKDGKFREDLFFRLYVVPIVLPPLKERKDDIILLAEHFLNELLPPGVVRHLSDPAKNKLLAYDWPGNVREVKNTIQRAILVSRSSSIGTDEIMFSDLSTFDKQNQPLEEQERLSLIDMLTKTNGNASEAARQLGIARTTLSGMIKRYGIDVKNLRVSL
jgi:DNA-binding NtrC family response regulator